VVAARQEEVSGRSQRGLRKKETREGEEVDLLTVQSVNLELEGWKV
jgi:hypothetical protein